ncbi:transcriptional regulator, LacI family [Pantoea sp. AS-PWVM4]|uniref:LacI family DNA-binding transcriptional regulator n=1 Tax=Pantoea sp. AS-PWVM4 TaxID=1332069 RepID=UPI0003AC770C|nr:LacI family DNA-binding transcriptional regulator [Pantoea sp. AS-PWVM4]ERK09532.1 transcriptional regulator, LacI family [Pantoea sp. AS-PWVM4]
MTKQKVRSKAPTVADVAREANVSKAQAARALGGYGAVSEEVQIRVNHAAAALGYRPNELARSMNTGRSNTIGVIVGDIENPHFGVALRGMADVTRQAGYQLLLSNSDEKWQAEQDAVRVMLEKQVDGIIVTPCCSEREKNGHLMQVQAEGRALKLFDRAVIGMDVEAICCDFTAVAQQATHQLIAAGHREVVYVTSMTLEHDFQQLSDFGLTPVAQRVDGMMRAFAAAGHPFDPGMVQVNAGSDEQIQQIVARLWQRPRPPTALIASDSVVAMSLLRELTRRGLRIPEHLSFVMYDNFPWSEIISPPLTVVAQPVYEMGREAARRLIAEIRGEMLEPLPTFSAELIDRMSIGAPRRLP